LPAGSLPTPYTVSEDVRTLFSHDLWGQIGDSLSLAGFGLSIGVILGFSLGLMSGLSGSARNSLTRAADASHGPFLALIPLFVVWMGIGNCQRSR